MVFLSDFADKQVGDAQYNLELEALTLIFTDGSKLTWCGFKFFDGDGIAVEDNSTIKFSSRTHPVPYFPKKPPDPVFRSVIQAHLEYDTTITKLVLARGRILAGRISDQDYLRGREEASQICKDKMSDVATIMALASEPTRRTKWWRCPLVYFPLQALFGVVATLAIMKSASWLLN